MWAPFLQSSVEFQSPYPRVEFGPQSAKINLLCQFLSLYQPPTKMVPINDWMGNFTVPLPHRSLQTLLAQQRKKNCITAAAFPLDQELCFQLVTFSHLDWKKSSNRVSLQQLSQYTTCSCLYGRNKHAKTTQRACRGNECLLVESARVWMVGNRAHLQTTL